MYRYHGKDFAGNAISQSGTLVQCLKWARRYYRRMGMIGEITRPDGTNLRECARVVG